MTEERDTIPAPPVPSTNPAADERERLESEAREAWQMVQERDGEVELLNERRRAGLKREADMWRALSKIHDVIDTEQGINLEPDLGHGDALELLSILEKKLDDIYWLVNPFFRPSK